MIRTATLEIPNIGRVRPDFEEMIIQAACDGVGTALVKVLPWNEPLATEIMRVARKDIADTIRATLETPVNEWEDRGYCQRCKNKAAGDGKGITNYRSENNAITTSQICCSSSF